MTGCAIDGCPGPAERPVRDTTGRIVAGPLVCPLHDDSGVAIGYLDERRQPHVRVDMARIRWSESSRRGRLIRAMLRGVGR